MNATTPSVHSPVRLPAEWEPVEAIWVAWPHNQETWPGRFERLVPFYANWVRTLAESTRVRILATANVAKSAETALNKLPQNVDIVPIATNDCWIRDYGPTFVQSNESKSIQCVDWKYNAWGGKYPPWDEDDAVPAKIAGLLGFDCKQGGLCLEGGALETDGSGRMIVFETCLVSESRNPNVPKQQIVQKLYGCLGVTEIVWLDGGGLEGDDTDGHVDQLARFVDRENVVVASCANRSDPNAAGLSTNQRQLELWARQTEPVINVHPLPIPPARLINRQRVPESYCNFVRVGSSRILVPTFGCFETDDQAIGVLSELCPTAEVTGVDCQDLVWGLGALHCASLNQPAG